MGISNLISKVDFTKEKKNFYSEISEIKFKETAFKKWEKLKSVINENSKSLKDLNNACKRYISQSKGDSKKFLNKVAVYTDVLSLDLKSLENIENLTTEKLEKFKSNSEALCEIFESISKKKFSIKSIEVLDYNPTKKAFECFGKNLLNFKKSVDDALISEMILKVKDIIPKVENAIKNQKFDSKIIEEAIYLPYPKKYIKLEICIDFSKLKDENERYDYLKQQLHKITTKFKIFSLATANKINSLLHEEGKKKFPLNTQKGEKINFEKLLCK